MNKKYFYAIYFAFIFSSCAVQFSLHDKNASSKIETKEVLTAYNQKNIPENINIKGKVIITRGTKRQDLNVNIKSKKDSLIWFSARLPIGIEMFRAHITKDSIYFLDRTRKTYSIQHISVVSKKTIPIFSLDDINKILTATVKIQNDTMYYQDIDKCVVISREEQYILNMQTANLLSIKKLKDQEIQVYYQDYQEINNQSFPSKIKIYLNKNENFFAKLIYRQISFPEKLMFNRFNIPQNYQYVEK